MISSVSMQVQVPSLKVFRETVGQIPDPEIKAMVQLIYLTAARISEVSLITAPSDLYHKLTKPYGMNLSYSFTNYQLNEHEKIKVLLIHSSIAKWKTPAFKETALPADMRYEPWTLDLLKEIQRRGRLGILHNRQWTNTLLKQYLWSLDPDFHTHLLRHYRLSHLAQHYGFDSQNLHTFAGWKMKGMEAIYVHLNWQSYFPKLCRPLPN